jgi:hypothetical protein
VRDLLSHHSIRRSTSTVQHNSHLKDPDTDTTKTRSNEITPDYNIQQFLSRSLPIPLSGFTHWRYQPHTGYMHTQSQLSSVNLNISRSYCWVRTVIGLKLYWKNSVLYHNNLSNPNYIRVKTANCFGCFQLLYCVIWSRPVIDILQKRKSSSRTWHIKHS